MSERVIPIHAQEYFTVSRNGEISQILIFDYDDPAGYYHHLVRTGRIGRELERMLANMQMFLDEERILVNGVRVHPEVRGIDLNFRGSRRRPSVTFIIFFEAPLRRGLNIYEDYYEDEVAEYDYEIYWAFPPGAKVKQVQMAGEHEVICDGEILVVWMRRGERTGGYERIEFILP